MNRPWMPLYVADYRADTAHLGALEHGIYLLLIMHYWQTGSLPDDEVLLARIASASTSEWKRAKPLIEPFFEPGWKHRRIEKELAKAADITSKRRASAEQMHRNRDANAHASAEQKHTQSPSHSPSQSEDIKKSIKAKSEEPPRHGLATQKHGGRVYIQKGTAEWTAYAEDYRLAHGTEPACNSHGGKWFKTIGESAA